MAPEECQVSQGTSEWALGATLGPFALCHSGQGLLSGMAAPCFAACLALDLVAARLQIQRCRREWQYNSCGMRHTIHACLRRSKNVRHLFAQRDHGEFADGKEVGIAVGGELDEAGWTKGRKFSSEQGSTTPVRDIR